MLFNLDGFSALGYSFRTLVPIYGRFHCGEVESISIQFIHIASFVAGASIVIKINYPLFINLLIVSIAIANNLEAARIIETGLWGGCGVLCFESVHMGLLFAVMAGQWYRVFPEGLLRLKNEEKRSLALYF